MAIHGSRSCLEPTDPDFRAHPSSLPFLTVPTAFPKVSYGFIWLAHEITKTRMGALCLPCRGRGCERPRSEPPRGVAPSPRGALPGALTPQGRYLGDTETGRWRCRTAGPACAGGRRPPLWKQRDLQQPRSSYGKPRAG